MTTSHHTISRLDTDIEVLVTCAEGRAVPAQAHPGDAGYDLVANESVTIGPLRRALIGTGISVALPFGYVGLVCPRSGMAAKHGVTVLNGPGIVDAGYRGEIKVSLHNTDPDQSFAVREGDRIAQFVIQQVVSSAFSEVGELPDSQRGAGGHGSSGGFGVTSK